MAIKVIIIGAGTGGLCLAQGLKLAGVPVEVYERDVTPTDRLQGYRLHISYEGSKALEACLPEALFREYLDTAAKPNDAVTFLSANLKTLLTIPITANPGDAAREVPVSRITLRKILLKDIDDIVRFGKQFTHYEQIPDGLVKVHFKDGSNAVGDVVIGADGAGSAVRRQLLPHAERIDTGILAITAKLPVNEFTRSVTPDAFFHGPTLIPTSKGRFLFGSAIEFKKNVSKNKGKKKDLLFDEHAEYIMWGFSAKKTLFANAPDIENEPGAALIKRVAGLITDWHPQLQQVINAADPDTMSVFEVKTSRKVDPWQTGNVTVLGDALHNMPPYQGMGANMALMDAARLCTALTAANNGSELLQNALHSYELFMISNGFAAVDAANKQMKQLHDTNWLRVFFRNMFFRIVNQLPVNIKRAVLHHR